MYLFYFYYIFFLIHILGITIDWWKEYDGRLLLQLQAYFYTHRKDYHVND
jgi:hypothetical protein